MLRKFYGSCAKYYIFKYGPLPFVAGTQLIEFQCLVFPESGTHLWVGHMKHVLSLMYNLPIQTVAFLCKRIFND